MLKSDLKAAEGKDKASCYVQQWRLEIPFAASFGAEALEQQEPAVLHAYLLTHTQAPCPARKPSGRNYPAANLLMSRGPTTYLWRHNLKRSNLNTNVGLP